MWASKHGLASYNANLVNELLELMLKSQADYTIFFRRLSEIPATISEHISALKWGYPGFVDRSSSGRDDFVTVVCLSQLMRLLRLKIPVVATLFF